jgi:hypothetical protein
MIHVRTLLVRMGAAVLLQQMLHTVCAHMATQGTCVKNQSVSVSILGIYCNIIHYNMLCLVCINMLITFGPLHDIITLLVYLEETAVGTFISSNFRPAPRRKKQLS